MCTSNPLRPSRVAVKRLTSATDPSYGTVWMKTNAFSPGLAWMSSKTFSSVLNRYAPSAGRSMLTVGCGIGCSLLSCRSHCVRSDCGIAALWGTVPGTPMAARHPGHDPAPGCPRQAPVHGDEHAAPEQRRRAGRADRRGPADLPGEIDLCGLHQVVLGIAAQPAGQPEIRGADRPAGHDASRLSAFWAASAIGSLSAPIGGEYTFSIQARSSSVTPVRTAMARKSARSLIPSPPTTWAPISRSEPGSPSSFTRVLRTPG